MIDLMNGEHLPARFERLASSFEDLLAARMVLNEGTDVVHAVFESQPVAWTSTSDDR